MSGKTPRLFSMTPTVGAPLTEIICENPCTAFWLRVPIGSPIHCAPFHDFAKTAGIYRFHCDQLAHNVSFTNAKLSFSASRSTEAACESIAAQSAPSKDQFRVSLACTYG